MCHCTKKNLDVCENVAAEFHSKSTFTNSVGKRLNRAEVFSQFGALKMDPQLKGDRSRLNFSRYVFHSVMDGTRRRFGNSPVLEKLGFLVCDDVPVFWSDQRIRPRSREENVRCIVFTWKIGRTDTAACE